MPLALILLVAISVNETMTFTLDQAIAYALENNPDIKQFTLAYEKTRDQVSEAASAFYPNLTASGYYAYNTKVSVFDLDGVLIPMGQNENYNVQVSLQQVLFAWGKIFNAYKISDLNRKIAELNLIRGKQEIRYSVTEAFYNLLVLDELVKLSRESLLQLKRHADAVETRYRAGLVSQFDLLRAQVQVANLKPQVIEAENGLGLAREGFKMLIGMDQEDDLVISGELAMTDEDFDLETLTNRALENRIELKNIKNFERIAALGQEIATRSNLPTVVGGATYARSKPFGFAGNEWGSNLTFNIGFEWPLFTGFKNLAQLKQARVALKEARLASENLENSIKLEVKQMYLNFLAAKEATVANQENIDQAEKTFEIIETRYKNGLATNLEFMDVQLALMQAKINYLSALKNYHTSRAGIYKAIGKEE